MKTFKRILTLSLSLALGLMLAVPALADDDQPPLLDAEAADTAAPTPISVYAYGTITVLEDGRLLLESPNPESALSSVVVGLSNARIIDGATGDPVAADTLADGDFVYAWLEPVMALSMPPQCGARVLVVNTPQDAGAPLYAQVVTAQMNQDGTALSVLTDQGDTLTLTADCQLFPHLTRNIVTLDSLVPGAEIMMWLPSGEDADRSAPEKVMMFPYAYSGWLEADLDGVSLSGEAVDLDGSAVTVLELEYADVLALPLRAVAEHLGYTVTWDAATRTAQLTAPGGRTVALAPGDSEATVDGEAFYLTCPATLSGGRTLLAVADVARLFDLYLAY